MDIEHHYYMTYIIALRAGYRHQTAHLIAYSSQYTDDNDISYRISHGRRNAYKNYFSQTINIIKPKKRLLRIYPMFHFLPGTKDEVVNLAAPRKDGKMHLLNTIPGNTNARALMKEAMDCENPYRIGIATHMFSDTWCHQNFVGCKDSFNAMQGLWRRAMPNVGHADAKHSPDIPGLNWQDKRLISTHMKINNTERILDAAGEVFTFFCRRDPGLQAQAISRRKQNLLAELSTAIGTRRKKQNRIRNYRSLIGEQFIEYDKKAWFNDAVKTTLEVPDTSPYPDEGPQMFSWKRNYQNSHWFNFQEAIKAHQASAEELLAGTFESMEVPKLKSW